MATHRAFSVDICKPKSVLLGLQVRRLNGFGPVEKCPLMIMKVHTASPVEEWNRMCARTFPDDVLRAGDIINNYFYDDTSLPATNGMETWLLIVVRRV